MAANPQVEKLKELGLRHGEKAAMGVSAFVFVLLLYLTATHKSIELTPDQVRKTAEQAESNLRKPQSEEAIVKDLDTKGIVVTHFEASVDEAMKDTLTAANYKADRAWVTLEPGAGLIRENVELIAVTDPEAYPGRGGALVYALDADGNKIPDDGKDKVVVVKRRKRRKNRAGMMGRGGMGGGMMGGMMKKKKKRVGKSKAQIAAEEKLDREIEEKRLKGLLAGKDVPKKEDAKEEEEEDAMEFKEITKGLRWVAVTATLDYKQLRDNYLKALKNPSAAYPNFKRADLERQELQSDGTWSEWALVDGAKNEEILFNLPETDDELTPEDVRLSPLVDQLPFLKAGYWEHVHIASLVPAEKKTLPDAPKDMGMGMGGPGGMAGMMAARGGAGAMGQRGMAGMMAAPGGGGGGMAGMMGQRGMAGMMASEGAMPGMGMGAGSAGSAGSEGDFEKSEAAKVMVRALDFTVEPNMSYRYRVRVVVRNPNRDRMDVAPGTDTKSALLNGPWSVVTNQVTMPPDVMPYAARMTARTGLRTDRVQFEVVRFNPEDGVTVVKPFDAGPGQVIGEVSSAQIPTSEGTGVKSKRIDFISREVVLDTHGGPTPLPKIGVGGSEFEVPSLALVVRPDGFVEVRSQARDSADVVRKDLVLNYKRELAESNKERQNSTGNGLSGMMGGMMGGGRGGMMSGSGR